MYIDIDYLKRVECCGDDARGLALAGQAEGMKISGANEHNVKVHALRHTCPHVR